MSRRLVSWVRPDRISSPMISTAAVTRPSVLLAIRPRLAYIRCFQFPGLMPSMDFPQPLSRGALVARYKRFFADVVLDDGREVTAHCPNPGAMLGLHTPGLPAWLSRSDAPKRKLAHTLELVEVDGALVVI